MGQIFTTSTHHLTPNVVMKYINMKNKINTEGRRSIKSNKDEIMVLEHVRCLSPELSSTEC
jgi:hypothetical protein